MNVCVCEYVYMWEYMYEHEDVCGCEWELWERVRVCCKCVWECWVGAAGTGINDSVCLEVVASPPGVFLVVFELQMWIS